MNLNGLTTILADASPAAAPAGTPQGGPPPWTGMVPIGLMLVVLYFVMLRPQSKKAKEHAAMLKSLRPGDKVVTSSGIMGTVVSVKEKSAAIRSVDTKLEVLKSAITDIMERGGDSGGSES